MKTKVTYAEVKAALENGFVSPLNSNKSKKISVKCSNAQEVPSQVVFSNGEMVVKKSLIQDDFENAYVKFFIDHNDGRSFGSTYQACEAIKFCNAMSAVI